MSPLITLALLCFLAAAEGVFSYRDQQILREFYNAQPSKTFTWDFSVSLCGQTGITCTDGSEGQEHVEAINLQGAGLTGSFPISFINLRNLRILDLSNNQLSGTIPSQNLFFFYSLQSLRLENNQITGTIPDEIREIQKLDNLDLSGNQLTGSIPSELATSILFSLDLSNNQLSGSIPPLFFKASSLSLMNFGNNKLTGTIPSEFGLLSSLNLLNLANNQLTGTIPTELGSLFLGSLILNNNGIFGKIPTELAGNFALGFLHLENNELSGPLPSFPLFFGNEFHVMGTNKLCPFEDYSSLGFESNDYPGSNDCAVCSPLSCRNGGVCSDVGGDYTCDCTGLSYEGNLCHKALCNPTCKNGGVCVAPGVCDCGTLGSSGKRLIYSGPTCTIAPRCPSIIEDNASWGVTLPPDFRLGNCLPNFSGRPVRKCNVDGSWGPIVDRCFPIATCPQSNSSYAHWPETPANQQANGICDLGYSGNPQRLCKASNLWDINITRPCTRITCPALQVGNTLFPKANSFQVQTATCQNGTKGRIYRTCQADGTWGPTTGNLCA